MMEDNRRLQDLVSVGKAILKDFELLEVKTVKELAKQDALELYRQLCRKTGARQDPCVLDVFRAAVAQAKDPRLPRYKCRWWYWSKIRKAAGEMI